MAGAMRKMAVYLGLVEDQDRYDDEFVDDHYDDLGADDHLEHTAEPVRRADSDLDGRGREHAATVATLADRRGTLEALARLTVPGRPTRARKAAL